MASIVADVAAERGVPVSVLMGRSRLKRDVRVRQEAIWRCREVRQDDGRPRYALQQIGQFFKRHHTTIIHACQRHLERTT
jgi:chromosomal replication initiation ATPase DnaA